MNSQQSSLFSTSGTHLDDQLAKIETKLAKHYSAFTISFGIYKAKTGPIDYNAMVLLTDNNGKNSNMSLHAESMHDLMDQVYAFLTKITKP